MTFTILAYAYFACLGHPQYAFAKVTALRAVDKSFNSTYWGPNGTVRKPIQELEKFGGQSYANSTDKRIVDIWVQFVGLNPNVKERGEFPTIDASIDGLIVFPSPGAPNGSILGSVTLPKSKLIGDIKLGIARGPYKPIVTTGPILVKQSEELTDLAMAGSKMYRSTFFLRMPEHSEGKDILARVHMRGGYVATFLLSSLPDEKVDGVLCRRIRSCPCRLADVVKVEFFQRPMTWMALRNIHLYPNSK